MLLNVAPAALDGIDILSASNGNHDDLVMNLVLFSWFASTNMFKEMTNIDLKSLLYEEKLKMIEDEISPVGFFNDNDKPKYTTDSDGNMWQEIRQTNLF